MHKARRLGYCGTGILELLQNNIKSKNYNQTTGNVEEVFLKKEAKLIIGTFISGRFKIPIIKILVVLPHEIYNVALFSSC